MAMTTLSVVSTEASVPDGRRRRGDESRRAILAAAARVIVDDGVAALTYRAVAEAADIPLARVSYHFGTIDDLMEAAATDYLVSFDARLRRLAEEALASRRSLVEACTDFLFELVTTQSREFLGMVEVRLALHRRGRTVDDVGIVDALASLGAGEQRAHAIVVAMFGYAVLAASALEPVVRSEVRTYVGLILGAGA